MNNNLVTMSLTTPALEKLFEGDPEIAFTLKKAAVLEFAKRRIDGILSEAAKADITAAIQTHVGTIDMSGYSSKVLLQKPILEMIQQETQKVLDSHKGAILKLIRETIDTTAKTVTETVTDGIDARIERAVEKKVDAELASRIADAVKTKMDKIMALAKEP